MRKISKKPTWQREIAKERIQILFDLARKSLETHPNRSRRYIELARKIGLRYNIRLAKEQKKSFCKKCNTMLIAGKTATIRLDSNHGILTIKCQNCKNIYRHAYK